MRVVRTTIPMTSIVTLEVCWTLRTRVLAAEAAFLAVEHLTMLFPEAFHNNPFQSAGPSTSVEEPGATYADMPALSRLSIRSVCVIPFPVATITQFVDTVAPAARLATLEVHNLSLDGDSHQLAQRAQRVVYTTD